MLGNERGDYMALAQRLKYYRKALKLTQQQVADALGIQRSAYAYYETDKSTPKLNTLRDLAKIFNVTVDSLLGNEEDENTGKILNVNSSNSFIDNWSVNDKFNQLSDYEHSVLIRLRLLSNDDKEDILKYIDKKFDK